MKRLASTLAIVAVFAASNIHAFDAWNTIAVKVIKSIAFMEGDGGSCTAFSIDTKRNYVMTAGHCKGVSSTGNISADKWDDKVTVDQNPVKLIAFDQKKDLMVLEVRDLDKPALHLAKDNPKVGDEMASYGFGYGLSKPLFRVTHVSAVDTEETPNAVITDTDFTPGQSGGPVVDTNGDVVMIVQAGDGHGLGLGIGAEVIRSKMGKFFEQK
jgi:S1-C subfamily serine protease